jgi:hypothetical protein
MSARRITIAGALALGALTVVAPAPSQALAGRYVSTIDTVAPCARSMRAVRLAGGAEDDLCAAWFGPRGRVIVGPMSAAPAGARWVGGA